MSPLRRAAYALLLLTPFYTIGGAHLPTSVDYAAEVNPRVGNKGKDATRKIGYLEAGFTFPGATFPFGMVQFTPTFFAPERGFVVNQLSGAGCANMGNFPTRAVTGELTESPNDMVSLPLSYRIKRFLASHLGLKYDVSPNDPGFGFHIKRASAGYFQAVLPGSVGAELTVTKRTGMARLTFPAQTTLGTVLIGTGSNATSVSNADVNFTGPKTFEAAADGGSFCGVPTPYKVYIVGEFDAAPRTTGTWEARRLQPGAVSAKGPSSGIYWTFDVTARKEIQYKFAISYVSVANARMNLAAENSGWRFDETKSRATAEWNNYLGRIEVSGGSPDHTSQFYTHLYHALIHPSISSDVNGQYIGGDHRVHLANRFANYTALSNWDAYRTQTPLLALIAPEIASDIATSNITFAQQSGGGFPRWVLADIETGTMFGDPTSIVVANAYAFGARSLDSDAALAVMRRGAEQPGTRSQNTLTRPLLTQYLAKGFVPGSMHLEYTSADFAIAQFALAAGDRDAYVNYMARSRRWNTLFNPTRKWLQSRKTDGSWTEPEADWVEASYKNYFWMVPYDLKGLIDTIGGAPLAEKRLDSLFSRLDGGYTDPWFAAGNEPDFQVPWIYNWVGKPNKTQATVKRVIRDQYHNRDNGLPGNDDMGAMGAWYVFANIGLYPMIPGVGGFAINSPAFPRVTIHLGSSGALTIVGGSEDLDYIEAMVLNGKPYDTTWLPLSAIEHGGLITFGLSERPNDRWAINAMPPSYR
jgi:predicted alpha-1,2-mannosidase